MITLYIVIYIPENELVRAFYSEYAAKDYISNSDPNQSLYEIKTVEWKVQ